MPEYATNHQIILAFSRYAKLLKSKPANTLFTIIFSDFLLQAVKILLNKNERMSYGAFRKLIICQDECLVIELYKKLNIKPYQKPKNFLISSEDEFLPNLNVTLRRTRKTDHIKQLLKEEMIDFSAAMFRAVITAFIIILIIILFSIK